MESNKETIINGLSEFFLCFIDPGIISLDINGLEKKLSVAIYNSFNLFEQNRIADFIASVEKECHFTFNEILFSKDSGPTLAKDDRKDQDDDYLTKYRKTEITETKEISLLRVLKNLSEELFVNIKKFPPKNQKDHKQKLTYCSSIGKNDFSQIYAEELMSKLENILQIKKIYPFGSEKVILKLTTIGCLLGIGPNKAITSRLLKSYQLDHKSLNELILQSQTSILKDRIMQIVTIVTHDRNHTFDEIKKSLMESISVNPIRELNIDSSMSIRKIDMSRPGIHVYLNKLIRQALNTKYNTQNA